VLIDTCLRNVRRRRNSRHRPIEFFQQCSHACFLIATHHFLADGFATAGFHGTDNAHGNDQICRIVVPAKQ
jgi:hypothetical protein